VSNFTKRAMLQLLRAYKWAVSPLLPPACRFVPTCSEYAMEAVERYGALRGGWLAFARILRCHPFARSGYDPVVKHATGCGKL
jgi:putative membrane protein insertion efficiency factor